MGCFDMAEWIGEYKIVRKFGEGGNADVFLAKNATDEEVAIKVLRVLGGQGKGLEKEIERKLQDLKSKQRW